MMLLKDQAAARNNFPGRHLQAKLIASKHGSAVSLVNAYGPVLGLASRLG
jgi:hypothetical protein